jgi:type VI secretion system protein ImpE
MLEAKTLFDAGKLDEAIQATINHVKSKPTDMTARTFLFELSIFSGDLERAERQLDVLGQQDADAMVGTQVYRQCIAAERKRQKVFHEGLRPTFLTPDVPNHVEMLIQALTLIREGKLAEAREKLDEAETERTVHPATLNGENKVSDLRDYNDVTSSVLEVFLKGEYCWLPLTQISTLEIVPPKNLRDLCWTQANVKALDGTNGEIHIPALYLDSWKHDDDHIRLGRVTDWREIGEEIYFGEGMRLFWIDGENVPMTNIKEIKFDSEAQEE